MSNNDFTLIYDLLFIHYIIIYRFKNMINIL